VADLDHRQQAAVDAGASEVFIAAGAGSGKTRVLTARFVAAVLGSEPYPQMPPESLLTVTFTEKAAGELAERVRAALARGARPDAARRLGDAWISTIHGMCARVLRQHALSAGLDPRFTVLDATEASVLEAEAEEQAVREALAADERVAQMLEEYGLDLITSALRSVTGSVRALGLTVEAVRATSVSDAMRQLEDVRRSLEEIAAALGTLCPAKAVDTAVVVLGAEIGALAPVLAEWQTTGDVGETTVRATRVAFSAKGLRRSAKTEGLDPLVEEAREVIARGQLCLAQLLVAARQETFLMLAERFTRLHRKLKWSRGMLDFEDLQVETARLLATEPAVRDRLRERFSMVMVDEFQDTNQLQLRILEGLSSENLCTVGDEKQSIYSFRYADVDVFRRRGAAVGVRHPLDINYRIEPALLRLLNRLFSHPALFGAEFMALVSSESAAERPGWPTSRPRLDMRFIDWSKARGLDSRTAEAECVADVVSGLISDGIAPGDIAVLMGAMAGGRAKAVEKAISAHGVAVVSAGGGQFFARREIAEVRALLRVVDNTWDDAALVTVLGGRAGGVSSDGLGMIRALADELASENDGRSAHLWDALTSDRLALNGPERRAVECVVGAVESTRAVRGSKALGGLIIDLLLDIDLDLTYFAEGSDGSRAWANVLRLARIAEEYESAIGGDVKGFLKHLELREAHTVSEPEATLDDDRGAVRVMSIHAAKGLEFPVVVVAGLADGPGTSAIEIARVDGVPRLGMKLPGDDGFESTLGWQEVAETLQTTRHAESKRLLYVACTRAKEALTIVVRTDPSKEAGDSLVGALRRAFGLGVPESIAAEGGGFRSWPREGSGGESQCAAGSVRLVPPARSSAGLAEGVSAGTAPASSELTASQHPADERGGLVPEAAVRALLSSRTPADPAPGFPALVSYTALAAYGACPRCYFLTHVLSLMAPPSPGGEALALGRAVHGVLERVSAGSDLACECERAARAAGLSPAARARLDQAVRAYLATDVAAEVGSADRVMHEASIAVPVGRAILVGAIDVLAWQGSDALIVDYKTGSAEFPEGEARERYRLQSDCYAFAAFSAGAMRVRVVFAELERGRQVTFVYDEGERDRLEATLVSSTASIDRGEFEPRASYDAALCETCAGFRTMCPVVP